MLVTLNSDKEFVRKMRKKIKDNDGYCPCSILKNDDTKCLCKDFRNKMEDKNFEGYCHCKLYFKKQE